MRRVCVDGMRMSIVGMRLVRVAAVRVGFVRVTGLGVGVVVVRFMCLSVRCDHVHFDCGDAASHHFAHFKTGAYVQRDGGLREGVEGNAGVNQCAEQHVAANAGKTFQISNTH